MVVYRRSSGPVFWELKACSGEWHSTLAHSHGEWSAAYIRSGSCEVVCQGRTVRIQAPALVWFPPETVHECRPSRTEDWAFQMLYWRAEGRDAAWGFRTLGGEEAAQWSQFFEEIDRGLSDQKVPLWLSDRGFGQTSVLTKRFLDIPSATGLARPDRPYKRLHGLPPSRHRTVLRLRWAQELLRRGRPPSEAALEAGFYDQSQFTRAFRAFSGTTPGRFAPTTRP